MLVWNETLEEFEERGSFLDDYGKRVCDRCRTAHPASDGPHGVEDCIRSLAAQVRALVKPPPGAGEEGP